VIGKDEQAVTAVGVAKQVTEVDHPEEVLRAWLEDQTFGSLHALEVRVSRDLDADDRAAWFFDVVLPDPPEDLGTWPVNDINDFHRRTRDKALEIGLDWPWYLRFRPQHDPDEDPNQLNNVH
jgi:hypothetical protein